jgi:hypothetical protein
MTKKPQKRDNDYYLDRLRAHHPAVYADFQAGKFKTAAEAIIAAGLRKKKSGLDQLVSAWRKATPSEQDAFKVQIGCGGSAPVAIARAATTVRRVASITPPLSSSVIAGQLHVDGYLSPTVVAQIKSVMARRGMKVGDVMAEMGFKKLNPSIGLAMNQGSRIKDAAVLVALERWLNQNSA